MRIKNFNLTVGEQIFKSLSDESRIRILFLLYHQKEMCTSDIEQVLSFTQTKTSRHLIYLRNAGLVNFRKLDQRIFYYIKDEVYDIVNEILKYMSKDTILQNDLETFRILYSNRELSVNRLNTSNKKWG